MIVEISVFDFFKISTSLYLPKNPVTSGLASLLNIICDISPRSTPVLIMEEKRKIYRDPFQKYNKSGENKKWELLGTKVSLI